jgi:hypothetical protein
VDGAAGNSVSNCCHASTKASQHKKATNCRLNLQEGVGCGWNMGKAVGWMTAGLGAYMTLKMWSEFNDALGTVFGASWGVIIATVAYLIYSIEKNDKAARDAADQQKGDGMLTNLANDDQPLGFIVGIYIFIIFVFEVVLGTL